MNSHHFRIETGASNPIMRRVNTNLSRRPVLAAGGLAFALALVCAVALGPFARRAQSAENPFAGDRIAVPDGELIVHPLNHATLALGWKEKVVYIDPVGGARRFAGLPKPDLVLITHLHFDHFDKATLKDVVADKTVLVAPPTVAEQMPAELRPQTTVLTNGQTKTVAGLAVEAVPAYNLTSGRTNFHPKGRDNGYVLTIGGARVYLSSDTEDVPEMRALKNIAVAFLCMNLPYTMEPDRAAQAVREFQPRLVYPYHCRGTNLEQFKSLVGNDAKIEVRLRNWYE
jgi:L-ascorbate metabolism protein UlaG (beta-lactamase superfamily)